MSPAEQHRRVVEQEVAEVITAWRHWERRRIVATLQRRRAR